MEDLGDRHRAPWDVPEWGKESSIDIDLSVATSEQQLLRTSAEDRKEVFFYALKKGNKHAIRNLLRFDRTIVNEQLYGFEGADVYESVTGSHSQRCYTYTGMGSDGFFYPLHVAAENGHKDLVMMLSQITSTIDGKDYRGRAAEEVATGRAVDAFHEMRGEFKEAHYRFEGSLDANGQKRQGELFYKPEGFKSKEYIVYHGGFKNDKYHGHGTLFWPKPKDEVNLENVHKTYLEKAPGTRGTDVLPITKVQDILHKQGTADIVQYVGRFRAGLKHGRGTEFNEKGNMLYQGNFRHDRRDGYGVEHVQDEDGKEGEERIYKGDFYNGQRHGFGLAELGPGHTYLGGFKDGSMCGVGLYVHPNGDRFEGTYFDNKPDGPGSKYEIQENGEVTELHGIWEKSKLVKKTQERFEPRSEDIPVITVPKAKTGMQGLMGGDLEAAEAAEAAAREKVQRLDKLGWRVTLMRYVRMTPDEARKLRLLGEEKWIEAPKGDDYHLSASSDGPPGKIRVKSELEEALAAMDEQQNTAEEQEVKDAEDLGGTHFKSSPVLYAAYSYVTSAAQIFETRLKKDGGEVDTNTKNADFENVFHCVMDAVEMYNDKWEHELQKEMREREEEREANRSREAAAAAGLSWDLTGDSRAASVGQIESPEGFLNTLSDRERKEMQMEQHRLEIAARRHGGSISMEAETRIALEVTKIMVDELTYLLFQDTSVPLNRVPNLQPGTGRRTSTAPITPRSSLSGGIRHVDKRVVVTSTSDGSGNSSRRGSRRGSSQYQRKRASVLSFEQADDTTNIFETASPEDTDEESDLDFLTGVSAPLNGDISNTINTFTPGLWGKQHSHDTSESDSEADSDASLVASNEFAAEVLFLIQQSQGYCTLEKVRRE